jgi:hypothetical protein
MNKLDNKASNIANRAWSFLHDHTATPKINPQPRLKRLKSSVLCVCFHRLPHDHGYRQCHSTQPPVLRLVQIDIA